MSDETPIQRAFELFGLLFFDNRFYSLGELASRLDVSKSTVTRLITRLENSKFGMITRKIVDKEAWYKFETKMNLSRLKINAEGLYMLAMCKDFLAEILPDKMIEQMEVLLKQLNEVLPKGYIQKKRNLGYFLSKGKINYEPHRETLSLLLDAINSKRSCELEYFSGTEKKLRKYAIIPESIVGHKSALYINCFYLTGEKKGQFARLPIHRIRNCRVSEYMVADLPDEHIPDDMDSFGLMGGEPFMIRAWFAPKAATYVSERIWSKSQRIEENPDGSIILEMSVKNDFECIAWILSFADAGKILEPEWLVGKVRDTIGKMLNNYAKGEI